MTMRIIRDDAESLRSFPNTWETDREVMPLLVDMANSLDQPNDPWGSASPRPMVAKPKDDVDDEDDLEDEDWDDEDDDDYDDDDDDGEDDLDDDEEDDWDDEDDEDDDDYDDDYDDDEFDDDEED